MSLEKSRRTYTDLRLRCRSNSLLERSVRADRCAGGYPSTIAVEERDAYCRRELPVEAKRYMQPRRS